MKVISSIAAMSVLTLLSLPNISMASNPASQEWVLQQISKISVSLTPLDWNAVCTSGSPTNSSGCYGNLSSPAFQKVNNAIGTFTTLANVPVANVPNSVFIKQFFAGANVPLNPNDVAVSTTGMAACGIFTTTGTSVGDGGVANNTTSPGSYYPYGQYLVTMGSNSNTTIQYNSNNGANTMVTSAPLYLLCIGYNYTAGAPPVAAALNITAV